MRPTLPGAASGAVTGRESRRTYGQRLQDELSFTPVTLRYNTGLRISANGRELAALLDGLVAGWPLGVEELVLVAGGWRKLKSEASGSTQG